MEFFSIFTGLVGGHCIGVDPYYLTYKAEKIGYKPKVILSGRKLNDSIPSYICSKILKINKFSFNRKVNILGFSFRKIVLM